MLGRADVGILYSAIGVFLFIRGSDCNDLLHYTKIVGWFLFCKEPIEPRREKTGFLPMRKQSRRSASQ